MSTQLPAPGTRWAEPEDDSNLWVVFAADPGGFPVLVARWLDRADALLLVHGAALADALDGLLDGLDANDDPERCGLTQQGWDARVRMARAVQAAVLGQEGG